MSHTGFTCFICGSSKMDCMGNFLCGCEYNKSNHNFPYVSLHTRTLREGFEKACELLDTESAYEFEFKMGRNPHRLDWAKWLRQQVEKCIP